jgi:cyclase
MTKLLFTLALTTALFSYAQDRLEQVEIITAKVTDQVYLLEGSGGNALIQNYKDKVVMIDLHYASWSKKIKKILSDLTDYPVTVLINTNRDEDNTGGNEGKSHEGIEHTSSITRKYDDASYGEGCISSSEIRTTIYDSLLLEFNNK